MGVPIEGIAHVTLPVTYLTRSVEFYRDVLDLAQAPRPDALPRGVWFTVAGSQQLRLIYSTGGAPDGLLHYHVGLRVADLDAARRHLASTGWPFDEPRGKSDGSGRLVLRDPDGHTVELCG